MFPCRPGDKRPAVPDWEHKACPDPERIARYWPSSRHNVGIATGPSRLLVLDLDCHGSLPDDWQAEPGVKDGRDVLAALCEWAGQPWPATYWVATPSGGWHLYFAAPESQEIRNSASLIGPQIDVRAAGGYVVGAGSVVGGKRYAVLGGQPPAPLPRWIARMLQPRPAARVAPPGRACATAARVAGIVAAVESTEQGQRNSVLHWASCRAAEMTAAGEADPGKLAADLVAAAVRAGLPEREAQRTVESGMRGAR